MAEEMTDKQLKEYIRKKLRWWVKWTGLGYWRIFTRWEEVIKLDHGGYDTAALCECDWKYQEATITFSLENIRAMNKSAMERTIVHELAHIFLNEMREEGIDHEERVATHLQKAFMWIRDAT